eukprot:CAMPEP_0185170358 /NCGR_PEP_ID=MMETSP1139-20130426/18581_1 /TAXON_ID=298111 /ORGANISM="Pavlova sp., Strain CCMP459" /LENGTH=65 /DNA_ID=CAMNT_0027735913 /DNA_START=477 /DNA_END=674 /DNA_ORIENTATION=+
MKAPSWNICASSSSNPRRPHLLGGCGHMSRRKSTAAGHTALDAGRARRRALSTISTLGVSARSDL